MEMVNQEGSSGNDSRKMVAIYPAPGAAAAGHLVPAVELGKLLVSHGLAVTIVLRGIPPDNAASSGSPFLSFHYILEVPLPPAGRVSEGDFVANVFELCRASNPELRDFLRVASPAALILDFFCYKAADVGADLGIPTYFLYMTCTAGLAVLLHLPVIHEQNTIKCSEVVNVPGVPPIPVNDLPAALRDRSSSSYQHFLALSEQVCKSRGVMVNSCRSLEPRATDAVLSGLCTFPGRTTPPLFCIGPLPLVQSENVSEKRKSGHECLSWLDTQPRASVLFLCFGSFGRFSAEQIKEIAAGLEISGQRFLWVVRFPLAGEQEQEQDALLPYGFLERTKDRGLVVMSWAPQRQVLAHASVGGFVTHCGWNSVLEAVVAGVPMLAWPLYAEQRMNRVSLVDEMQLAVAVEGRQDDAIVTSEEIGRKVSWLMDSDGGRELRERTLAAMGEARKAMSQGGESSKALLQLVEQWIM